MEINSYLSIYLHPRDLHRIQIWGRVDCFVCTEEENKGLLHIFKIEGVGGIGTLSVGGSNIF